MISIATNVLSQSAQGHQSKAQSSLATALERLSSGLRINSAKDDAAGQAIANRMTSQITGLAQAQRNINDGVSLVQTAEGALDQVNDRVQRIRELTVRALNDTNSDADLRSIQGEINRNIEEINRVAYDANFNGIRLFEQDKQFSIQVGANTGEAIDIALTALSADDLGLEGFSVVSPTLAVSAAIRGDHDLSDAAATLSSRLGRSVSADSLALRQIRDAAGELTDRYVVEHDDLYYAAYEVSEGSQQFDVVTGGFHTAIGGGGAGASQIAITVGTHEDGTVQGYAAYPSGFIAQVTSAFDTTAAIVSTTEFRGVTTPEPLKKLDDALRTIDSLRSSLGATQNRLESAATGIQSGILQLSTSRSRIEDADYAVEVSNMTKAQILQQAGTSMLAQANQVPQNVLSLLG